MPNKGYVYIYNKKTDQCLKVALHSSDTSSLSR